MRRIWRACRGEGYDRWLCALEVLSTDSETGDSLSKRILSVDDSTFRIVEDDVRCDGSNIDYEGSGI